MIVLRRRCGRKRAFSSSSSSFSSVCRAYLPPLSYFAAITLDPPETSHFLSRTVRRESRAERTQERAGGSSSSPPPPPPPPPPPSFWLRRKHATSERIIFEEEALSVVPPPSPPGLPRLSSSWSSSETACAAVERGTREWSTETPLRGGARKEERGFSSSSASVFSFVSFPSLPSRSSARAILLLAASGRADQKSRLPLALPLVSPPPPLLPLGSIDEID